jgi:putative CocE/NonD family hydrolase
MRHVTRVLLPLTLAAVPLAAQERDYVRVHYSKHEYHIPMRDGVRLFLIAYVPKDTTQRYPIILTRTPYSVRPYEPDSFPHSPGNQHRAYFHAGYIVAFEDVRGRYMSEGQYVNVRPYVPVKHGAQDIDETTDTYDTVEWLMQHVQPNNGRVGISGISYPGFYSSMGAIDAHPAVKAVSPQAPVSKWMGGDDFFHNGALLFPHGFDFYLSFGKARAGPHTEPDPHFEHGTPDGYEFYLNLGAVANGNSRYMHDSVPFWKELTRHGTWDDFWAARNVLPHLQALKPAMLWVGGWFDTENLWGALHAYAAAERQSPGTVNRLVMGPWAHGQWSWSPGDSLGVIAWGQATSLFYTDSIELPFMSYYLKEGSPKPREFEAAVFETGTNAWRFLERWPPAGATTRRLYLREHGGLAFAAPGAGAPAYDEYVSDPDKPVPYTAEITHWYNPAFMLEDQRFAGRRPDVLVYATEPLASDLTVAGPIDVDFRVSTSGTDCDWIVKLIDVYPDSADRARLGGYEMLIRGDVLRGKFRNSISRPEPFVPGRVTPIRFDMSDVFHTFKRGHRVMVQVQSTWFPMIDRNPGRFEDIYHAAAADFHKTVQRVYRSGTAPSAIVLPVLP